LSSINDLVPDIYKRLKTPGPVNKDALAGFAQTVADVVARRLEEQRGEAYLRMSNLGQGDRKLWYSLKTDQEGEDFEAHTLLKFLIGDLWEAIILYLAEEAGHKVTHKQGTVEVDGVKGSNDAIIDDVVVDVKSCSPHAFRKFKNGNLAEDDPFGYMEQLAGYVEGNGGTQDGAFLACDKTLGHITLLTVPNEELKALDIRGRIEHIKKVLEGDKIPDRCYNPVPEGVSGNEVLDINCSYCPFKFECWKDTNRGIGLRTFLYSKGPVHFTTVAKEPKVMEITF
jgi:hypothetical protein